jgi:ribosomal-protein-alanine N-acetyltransferase
MRPCSTDDAEFIAIIHNQREGSEWTESDVARLLQIPAVTGFVANNGYIICLRVGMEIEVIDLAVDQAAQRKGTGQALLQAVINLQPHAVFLEAAETNTAALALYTKLGFRKTGRRKGYYNIGGKKVDAVVMALSCQR